MQKEIRAGLSFGLTSGIITTLGMIVGLNFATAHATIIITGILLIATADALSDGFGMHMAEEARGNNKGRSLWRMTFFTFLFKFLFALTFVVPFLLVPLALAVIMSILWGALAIVGLNIYLARLHHESVVKIVGSHLALAALVILLTYLIGTWSNTFI